VTTNTDAVPLTDERPTYIFLARGDVIRATDERYSVTYHRWKPIAPLYVGTTVDASTRPVRRRAPASEVQADHIADERNMGAGEVQADSCARLVAFHAAQLDSNPYCYFELAYTRQTDWMAWITDRPAQGEPGTAAYAKSRKVIVRGQGPTAQEACTDALAALAASFAGDQEVGS
jgi:hypothetical protein